MANVPQMSTNVFGPDSSPMRGDLADAISGKGLLAGILSQGVGVLNAGDRVKLDSTNTTPGLLSFVAAADNEAAFGVLKRVAKQTAFDSSDETKNRVEVAYQGGPIMYEVGGGTLTPGASVGMSAGFLVAADGGHSAMGLLIDFVAQSTVGRVILGFVAS